MYYTRFYNLKRDCPIVLITDSIQDSIDIMNRYSECSIEIEEITAISEYTIIELSKYKGDRTFKV